MGEGDINASMRKGWGEHAKVQTPPAIAINVPRTLRSEDKPRSFEAAQKEMSSLSYLHHRYELRPAIR